jgi:hypothetical protein
MGWTREGVSTRDKISELGFDDLYRIYIRIKKNQQM